jgi:hypothetical protein
MRDNGIVEDEERDEQGAGWMISQSLGGGKMRGMCGGG